MSPSAIDVAVAEKLQRVAQVFQRRFRPRRMRRFIALFDLRASDRVIDIGGYERNWQDLKVQPHVLIVNLEREERRQGRLRKVCGDGRHLPYADMEFHIAYSNSVIEHVGTWADQVAFAGEVARVAPRYFVQTPNKWFPIEPHLMGPPVHLLPRRWRRVLVRYGTLWGWIVKPTAAQIDEHLRGIAMLDAAAMHRLFPDAEIHRERFLGLTKSIIAIRR